MFVPTYSVWEEAFVLLWDCNILIVFLFLSRIENKLIILLISDINILFTSMFRYSHNENIWTPPFQNSRVYECFASYRVYVSPDSGAITVTEEMVFLLLIPVNIDYSIKDKWTLHEAVNKAFYTWNYVMLRKVIGKFFLVLKFTFYGSAQSNELVEHFSNLKKTCKNWDSLSNYKVP